MAKDITLKSPNGEEIYYPKTVSDLVFDNETGITIKDDIDSNNNHIDILNKYINKSLYNDEEIYIEDYSYNDGGYYIIHPNNVIESISSTANSVCKMIEPIKVYKGDIIELTTRSSVNSRPICGFIENDTIIESDVVTNTYLVDSGNTWQTVKVESDKEQYFIATVAGQNFTDKFKINIYRGSSVIDKLQNNVDSLLYKEYYGEKNGGNISSEINGRNGNKNTTVELFFRIEDMDNDVNVYSTGSTTMFWIKYFAQSKSIRISYNSGNIYEVCEIKNIEKNRLFHIVFVLDLQANVKRVYLDGKHIATSNEITQSLILNDSIYSQTFFIKRIWGRVLSDDEIFRLYNNGYPTEYTLTDSIKESLLSSFEPKGISDSCWVDNVSGKPFNFDENVVLERNNPCNIFVELCDLKETSNIVNNPIEDIIYPQFETIEVKTGSHDCTFIGNDFVSTWYEGAGTGNIGQSGFYYIDLGNRVSLKQNYARFLEKGSTWKILQLKSLDYKFNKLLIGTGRAKSADETTYEEQGSYLYIFNEAEDWKNQTYDINNPLTFNNCGSYNEIDVSELGVKVYGFWGQRKDSIYVSCNFFRDIYLIQLGTGSNNLGKGSFVSSNSDEYNGSYTIINHWNQNKDWTQSIGGSIEPMAAHGGQYYKGYLYLAVNEIETNKIYRCKLKNNGTLKFDVILLNEYMGLNQLKYKYIDGIALKDDILYVQPLVQNNQYKNDILLGAEL